MPAYRGWMNDYADVVSPAKEAELETLMESYRQGSENEIAFLSMPTLNGGDLEQFALEVGRSWGIGKQGKNNGALFLIVPGDRLMRIEVGRGLEGDIPDVIAGRIIRDVVAPRFRAGKFDEGVELGIRSLHAAAGGDYGPLNDNSGSTKLGLNELIFFLFFAYVLISILRSRSGGGGGGLRGHGRVPWIVIGAPSSGGGGGFGGGGFGGFGGGGGFSGGGASGGW